MRKRLEILLWALAFVTVTYYVFFVNPNEGYSPIARGKFIGIFIVVFIFPVLFIVILFLKKLIRRKSVPKATEDFKKEMTAITKGFRKK